MKDFFKAIWTGAVLCWTTLSVAGSIPDWWSHPSYGILDSSQTPDNWAPVNAGQLKYVATQAKAYFDAEFPGGAGAQINSLVSGFSPGVDPENYAPVNVGQLKHVAKVFYDRMGAGSSPYREVVATQLVLLGADPTLISNNYPTYPWGSSASSENWHPANIGQLKLVFGFDFSVMESLMGVDPLDLDPSGDSFLGYVKAFAGLASDPGYFSSSDAASWPANTGVEQAMGSNGELYVVLPDRGPFVGRTISVNNGAASVSVVNLD
ncbi:MAG: hypothetical protein JJU20_13890 [Opitutales bacterium]|nr:hypothetical protein [Opitutales bacterium]